MNLEKKADERIGTGYYFALWCKDQRSLQETRLRNMMADINAGYYPFGESISNQVGVLESHDMEYNHTFEMFSHMDIEDIDQWCKEDLVKRGAI